MDADPIVTTLTFKRNTKFVWYVVAILIITYDHRCTKALKNNIPLPPKNIKLHIKIIKSPAQDVRQKNDISERRSKAWRGRNHLQALLCLQHVQLCHCATCPGSSYTKNEYSLFYQKFDAEYFLSDNFFEKSCIFREKRKKLFWGRIWQFFRERRSLTPKINITFLSQMRYPLFYYLPIFSKNV